MTSRGRTPLIAVVGGSGAGKSWLVRQLCRLLGDHAGHLALDDFYLDRSHLPPTRRARLNFDVPQAIDWSQAARVLRDCRAGVPTFIPRYNFATYCRHPELRPWAPRRIVFVEGLWLLRSAELRPLFDLGIYLDTPAEVREARRVARDTVERGYSAETVRGRLAATVFPMHGRYVEPLRRWANLVLAQPYSAPEVERLADHLWPLGAEVGALPYPTRETFRAELLSLLLAHEYAN